MTTETLVCDRCGAKLRIETDDQKFLDQKKAEFEKKHVRCVKK